MREFSSFNDTHLAILGKKEKTGGLHVPYRGQMALFYKRLLHVGLPRLRPFFGEIRPCVHPAPGVNVHEVLNAPWPHTGP